MEDPITPNVKIVIAVLLILMLTGFYISKYYYKNHYDTNSEWLELRDSNYTQYKMRYAIDQHHKEVLTCADFKELKVIDYGYKLSGIIMNFVSPIFNEISKRRGFDMSCPNQSTYYNEKLSLFDNGETTLSMTDAEVNKVFDVLRERYNATLE